MNERVLILACGSANHRRGFKVNRHLVPVAGVPMILRTVRQLAERGHRPTIATYHEDIKRVVGGEADYFLPEYYRWYPETLLYTRPLWADFNAVLLGDTIYSDEVLDEILSCLHEDALWIHGKPFGDFDAGVTFSRQFHSRVAQACCDAVGGIIERKRKHGADAWVGSTGPFMRALHGIDLWTTPDRLDYEYHRVIDVGFSKDFDKPGQYDAWLKNNEWAT
jgi:hypothetical protein